MKRKKCYIYMRVSTAMQVDGYSLEAQKDRLTKFAEFQKMDIVREYCDAGKSGKNITGRPEFSQMLRDIADGRDGVDYILVFKLSRFGRNAADVLNSLQYIQDFGVNLICVEDGIDSSKDSGKLTITVLSAVAEIERENILVQTMEGRKQKAREGKWNGGLAPFGYRLDSKTSTLVVEHEEAEVVKIIYEKFVHDGMGADSICSYLNQRGYAKQKNREFELNYFTRGLIMRVLDNPVYIGKITYGKSTTERVKGTRDEYQRVQVEDYMVTDGKHEAIIDEELWAAAQERRKETGVKWNKTHSLEHEHLLSGLLICPVCGKGLAGTVRRRKNKKTGEYKDDFYYRCQHRKKIDEEHFCDFKPSINQNEFNREVESVILDMAANEQWKEFVLRKMSEKVDVSTLEAEREQLRKQLRQVIGAKTKLTDLEKKEFLRDFIESVEIYPEKMDNGRMLKQINFNFPVYYDGEVGKEIRLLNENTVETVVLLSKLKPDDIIEVKVDLDELDATTAETKATYPEIKEYVLQKYGLKAHTAYIAQVKRKYGIDMRKNYNVSKKENPKARPCPANMEEAIYDALKHFAMV